MKEEKQEQVKEEIKEVKKHNKKDELRKEFDFLKQELSASTEKYLRLQAEFSNFRSRTELEKERMLKYEGENFIKELLIIVDNFESAIKLDSSLSQESSKFLEGFKMIYANLVNLLNNIGIKEIEVINKEFDPHVAEAVITEEDKTKKSGSVLEVFTKGYIYKDKVIRPAMVKVNR